MDTSKSKFKLQGLIDADAMSRKPFILPEYSGDDANHQAIDTIRTLTQAQDEVSSADVSGLICWHDSKPEIVEYILSLELVQDTLVHAGGEGNLYPPLGAALRNYGAHIASDSVNWEFPAQAFPAKWESIIRKLLHIGVDVHAPVPREDLFHSSQSEIYPCILSAYGTPLDELFTYTRTAGEAQDAVATWLQILSTEGVDVSAYLEKEVALHATQPMFTCSQKRFVGYPPRQLFFNLGEAPTVYADWWIDPECSTYLVRQEFKDTNILTDYGDIMWEGWKRYDNFLWKRVWPIGYPWWSDSSKPPMYLREDLAKWEQLSARAQERADRRWQKKARKAVRQNGTRIQFSMPGAWPK